MKEIKSDLPIIPLRDVVVFPGIVTTLFVGRPKSIEALNVAMSSNKKLVLVSQLDPAIEDPEFKDLYNNGSISNLLQLIKLPDGTMKVLVEGHKRCSIEALVEKDSYDLARVISIDDIPLKEADASNLVRFIKAKFEDYIGITKRIPPEIVSTVDSLDDLSKLIDTITGHLPIETSKKQEILSIADLKERSEKVLMFIESQLDVVDVEKKIRERVKKQMEKSQREYYLNEQIKAAQKELGEIGEEGDELEALEEKINTVGMPKDALKKAKSELAKFKHMSPSSAEASVVRSYLDCLVDVPWKKRSKVKADIQASLDILEEDHYGLEEVKERIIEYLAVQKRVKSMKAPVLCLVGPPGVGKTSLGESIARATNRKFVRMSLGGVRDESEIRGHRRTYIGSMPGRFIQAMKKTKTSNPIILLDEIDKVGSDWRGAPSSALLEVLDPEQNNQFNDHYLEVDYDLSNVMFICTGNTYNIPGPLLDRLEVIEVSGYTEKEKVEIARKYLIPRKMNKNILKNNEFKLDKSSITKIVRHYTRESGVRGLEKVFDKLFRKLVFQLEKNKSRSKKPFIFDDKAIKNFLGAEKFKDSVLEKKNLVGITNGLAWTQVGGDILNIEVNLSSGKGMINATGKLGDVMKESITAALGYIKSNSVEFGVNPKVFDKVDIHLHVPEGAIPKDGPSAGITIFTSLISSLTEIKIKRDIAMTGEITLKGRVLPIGGLKEKLLAAIRYGIKTVIIPKENEKDLAEIQKDIQNKLVIKKVEFAKEVLDLALDGKISKINKKLDWRHLVTESMKPKNQQNQEKTFVN